MGKSKREKKRRPPTTKRSTNNGRPTMVNHSWSTTNNKKWSFLLAEYQVSQCRNSDIWYSAGTHHITRHGRGAPLPPTAQDLKNTDHKGPHRGTQPKGMTTCEGSPHSTTKYDLNLSDVFSMPGASRTKNGLSINTPSVPIPNLYTKKYVREIRAGPCAPMFTANIKIKYAVACNDLIAFGGTS